MSSLASFFEKRQTTKKQSNLTDLFAKDANKKFQQLQKVQKSEPIHIAAPPKKDEPEDLTSTVFVGNVPLSCKQKDLKKLFEKYGKIDKIWFRSVPVEQNKKGKKANFILKNFIQGAQSMNAYVKFSQQSSAQSACAVNGTKIQEHTLRVFSCLDDNLDYETTIFVGNLPFDIKQQQLRKHFEHMGQIVNVRVVKNKNTFQGIGIGYVRFNSKPQMVNAIQQMNESNLKGRTLRVKRAIQKGRLQKKASKIFQKKLNKKGYTAPKKLQKQISQMNARQASGGDDQKQKARRFHFKRKMIKK